MKKVFAFCLLLCGCATNEYLMTTPEGNNVYMARCDFEGTSACFREAQKACPMGFDIMNYNEQYVNLGSHTTGNMNTYSFGNATAFGNTATGWGNSFGNFNSHTTNQGMTQRSLMYVCRPFDETPQQKTNTK